MSRETLGPRLKGGEFSCQPAFVLEREVRAFPSCEDSYAWRDDVLGCLTPTSSAVEGVNHGSI